MITCLILVALPAEARPLIDYFKLKIQNEGACRSYCAGNLMLVETGMGKLNAASATAAALSMLQQTQGYIPACLNVGLAGVALPLGTLLTAHTVIDQASGKKWFPQLTCNPITGPVDKTHNPTIAVCTVDVPEQEYLPGVAYDMEAAGIYTSAVKFTTLEFIQSQKIVSDNAQHSVNAVDKSLATTLIARHCNSIEQTIKRLIELADALPDVLPGKQLVDALCLKMHCTATQRAGLLALLRRYHARFNHLPALETLTLHKSAKTLAVALESDIASAPRVY